MAGVLGVMQKLRFVEEETWGGLPPSPSYIGLPISEDGYTLSLRGGHYFPAVKIGTYQRKYSVPTARNLEGSILLGVWPEVAEYLFAFAIGRDENGELPSYTFEFSSPGVEAKRHLGCKVDTLAIAASADRPGLLLSFDLIGKAEETISDFSAPSVPAGVPFVFQHASFEIDEEESQSVEAFTIEVANNLVAGPHGSDLSIAYLLAGLEVVTGTVTVLYDRAAYNQHIRQAAKGSFKATFTHPSGGSPVPQIVIYLPQIVLTSAPEAGGPGDIIRQTLNFEAELPPSGDQIQLTIT